MKCTNTCLFAVVVLIASLKNVESFPNGAGSCLPGVPFPDGTSHLTNIQADDAGDGLEDAGFSVFLDGNELDPETPVEIEWKDTFELVLVATGSQTFRGHLMRLGGDLTLGDGGTIDTRESLVPIENSKVTPVCTVEEEVGGITHTDNSPKTRASADLVIDVGDGYELDVTVVAANTLTLSSWYNSRYVINVAVGQPPSSLEPTVAPLEPTTSPTNSLTMSPNDSPLTDSPTEAPTVTPLEPTSAPTRSQTTSPTNSPTTVSLTDVPTVTPTEPPEDSPTTAPSDSPVVSPTSPPMDSPSDSPIESPTLPPSEAPLDSPTVSPTNSLNPPTPELTQDYFTLDSVSGGCLGLTDDHSKLRLLKCETDNEFLQWRLDSLGRFHSRVDDNACMEVGRGTLAEDGTPLRGAPCSESEFQQFIFDSQLLFGPIQPIVATELCITYRGVNANIGDPIILKECSKLDDDRALGWEGTNPDTHGN